MVGNLIYGATQWGILVLLARMGSPEAVGQFSLGLAITAPIMLFSGLQLRSIQATDARGLFGFADYAGLRMIMTIAAVLMIFVIGATAHGGETTLVIAAFALAKGTESLSDIVYGLWQRWERMDLIAQSLMLRGGAALIVTPICFVVSHTVWVAVCGMAIAWALVLIVFDIPYACIIASNTGQPIIPRFGASTMKRLISLSLPLGIVTMLQSFSSNIPRYLIGQIRGVHELGLFSAPAYVLLAGSMTVNALAQSAIPRLAFYHSQGNLRDFRNLSNQLILIGLGLGAAGVLVAASFGRQILTAIYGRDYAHNSGLFVLLMAAAAPGYMASFAGYSLTAARHFRIQMPIFGLVTAVTIVLSYLMVKSDGATGAARALAIATLVQFLLTYGMMRHMDSYKN